MFYAINSKTNEMINSLTVEENISYQFIDEEVWYADPNEIESCPKEIDINKIEVKFRKGSTDVTNWNGTKYDIAPHFFIPNKSKLGINCIPESKEHKLAKNWIYNKLKQKELIINYSSINKPYKYHNTLNLFELDINVPLIGIEVTSSTLGNRIYRRADVICPFIKNHKVLGNGIVFEIQFSEQREKTKVSRELDWAIMGYSVAWLYSDDFDIISDTIIAMKKQEVKVDSFANLIKQNNKMHIRDLKLMVQELCRQLDAKKEDIREDIRKEVRDIIDEEMKKMIDEFPPICPECNTYMKLLKSKSGDAFWGCRHFPLCRHTQSLRK